MHVDALSVPPNALFARARFPRLPNLAKTRHHHRLDVFNSSLALADGGALLQRARARSGQPNSAERTVLVAIPLILCSSPLAHSGRVTSVAFSPSH